MVREIGEDGRARDLGLLHAVLPEGYFVEAKSEGLASGFHRDLPYFMHDLRPAGFLGRLVPRHHPELGLPADARLWSDADVLRYVGRFGWNLPGSFIVGDAALTLFLEHMARPAPSVELRERARIYAHYAQDVLRAGAAGSSAAGEQPKFLARRAPDTDVLVKFSSAGKDPRSRREADLLIAEHLAHGVLRDHGQEAARSELVYGEDQVFLEIERFDRVAGGGRRGVVSLFALDAEYLGSMKSWSDSVSRLAQLGKVPAAAVESTRLRECFGRLIGNTDMHPGNLSFMADGTRVLALAPAYDMLPMMYAIGARGVDPELELAVPSPQDAQVWQVASSAALEFWELVVSTSAVSQRFRRVAQENVERVRAWSELAQRLPPAT
jgi:hypothetical protein